MAISTWEKEYEEGRIVRMEEEWRKVGTGHPPEEWIHEYENNPKIMEREMWIKECERERLEKRIKCPCFNKYGNLLIDCVDCNDHYIDAGAEVYRIPGENNVVMFRPNVFEFSEDSFIEKRISRCPMLVEESNGKLYACNEPSLSCTRKHYSFNRFYPSIKLSREKAIILVPSRFAMIKIKEKLSNQMRAFYIHILYLCGKFFLNKYLQPLICNSRVFECKSKHIEINGYEIYIDNHGILHVPHDISDEKLNTIIRSFQNGEMQYSRIDKINMTNWTSRTSQPKKLDVDKFLSDIRNSSYNHN